MNIPKDAGGYLIDLDGTLMSGRTALPGAVDLLAQLRDRFVIVSNDAEHTPVQLAGRLSAAQLFVPAERIVLAGTSALDAVAMEQPRAKIMLFGSVALRRYARRLGLRISDERPDLVLLARDRSFSYAKLMKAANAVRAGASLVISNPDRTHPGPTGDVVPETGALAAALLACTGPVPYRVFGKPEPMLFERGLALLGIRCEQGIVIGDNPETDGAGASRLGLRFVHVRPGAPLRLQDIASKPSAVRDFRREVAL